MERRLRPDYSRIWDLGWRFSTYTREKKMFKIECKVISRNDFKKLWLTFKKKTMLGIFRSSLVFETKTKTFVSKILRLRLSFQQTGLEPRYRDWYQQCLILGLKIESLTHLWLPLNSVVLPLPMGTDYSLFQEEGIHNLFVSYTVGWGPCHVCHASWK